MLIGEIIAGYLLPWLLVAPAIPLLLLLIRRTRNGKTLTVLAMLCVASILSHVFLLIASGSGLEDDFIHVSFLVEFFFTGLLLKFCTDHSVLRYSILTAILIFGSVYITYVSLLPRANSSTLMLTGVLLVFLVSILVLLSKLNKLEQNILSIPDFWFTAGIFFHFGLLSLLFLTAKKSNDLDYHDQNEFSILYVVMFFIQFLFFTVGVIMQKPWSHTDKKA
jgi:hypothetical protein